MVEFAVVAVVVAVVAVVAAAVADADNGFVVFEPLVVVTVLVVAQSVEFAAVVVVES